MKLVDLMPAEGAVQTGRRKGRGPGSGLGKTSGKGHKGQKARAGHGFRPGFEGGQMPLQRRIPKRGFNNIFAKEIVAINLNALNAFEDGAVVDQAALVEAGIVKSNCDGVKVLSNGKLTKKVTVKVSAFSAAAKEKIEAAGGKCEVI